MASFRKREIVERGGWTTSRVRAHVLTDHTLETLQQVSGSVQRWRQQVLPLV